MKNKKITLATLKSFIKNNTELFLNEKSRFSGMIDGLEYKNNGLKPIEKTNHCIDRSLGIQGLWVVGSSRDYFTYYNDGNFEGIECSNSCGNWILAKKINPGK